MTSILLKLYSATTILLIISTLGHAYWLMAASAYPRMMSPYHRLIHRSRKLHNHTTHRSNSISWRGVFSRAFWFAFFLDHCPRSRLTWHNVVLGGSNFAFNTSTAALRNSDCTSIPIPEDKSNYWFPVCCRSSTGAEQNLIRRLGSICTFSKLTEAKNLTKPSHSWIRWANGTFTSVNGSAVMYVSFSFFGIQCDNHSTYAQMCDQIFSKLEYPVIAHSDYLFSDPPGNTTAFPDDVSFYFQCRN